MSEQKTYVDEFENVQSGAIPWVDVDNLTKIPESFREKFTETDFSRVIQRNVERLVIAKEYALLSVAAQSVPQINYDNINVRMTHQPAGGVSIEYPVSPRNGDTAAIKAVKEKPTTLYSLDRADLSYLVTPEANILGENSVIHQEYMMEAKEQLAANIDNTFIKGLADSYATSNTADVTWKKLDSDGDYAANIDKDLNDAIATILTNTSINPNIVNGSGSKWTLILPISMWGVMKQTRVIDNHRLTYENYLMEKHKTQILWSRKPFGFEGTWNLANNGWLFPTMDRKVGNIYVFSGRPGAPSMYREVTPKGERITMQYWFSYIPSHNEETGEAGNTNNRIFRFQDVTDAS